MSYKLLKRLYGKEVADNQYSLNYNELFADALNIIIEKLEELSKK